MEVSQKLNLSYKFYTFPGLVHQVEMRRCEHLDRLSIFLEMGMWPSSASQPSYGMSFHLMELATLIMLDCRASFLSFFHLLETANNTKV